MLGRGRVGLGGGGALGLAGCGRLVVVEEQLGRRGFCAETAMLARGGDGEGRGCGRGAVGVIHSHYAESVVGQNAGEAMWEKKLRYASQPGQGA